MKRTHSNRQAFLDSLEKKYRKKVQLHAFKQENKALKQQLAAMRGERVSHFRGSRIDMYEPDYRVRFS